LYSPICEEAALCQLDDPIRKYGWKGALHCRVDHLRILVSDFHPVSHWTLQKIDWRHKCGDVEQGGTLLFERHRILTA
jgi:hypothetical protein